MRQLAAATVAGSESGVPACLEEQEPLTRRPGNGPGQYPSRQPEPARRLCRGTHRGGAHQATDSELQVQAPVIATVATALTVTLQRRSGATAACQFHRCRERRDFRVGARMAIASDSDSIVAWVLIKVRARVWRRSAASALPAHWRYELDTKACTVVFKRYPIQH